MALQFGSFPFDSIQVDNYAHPLFINANRAPTSNDIYTPGTRWQDSSVDPKVIYETTGSGDWNVGGNDLATTSEPGIVLLDDDLSDGAAADTVPTSAATKTYVDGVAIAGAPDATEVTKGIAELANTAEAEAGTDDERIMTSLKVTQLLDSGNHSIDVTTIDGSGAVNIDTTGAISLDADAASNFSVSGAGVDLSLESAAGRVIVNGEEAAANAITLLSAAGGIDADAALQINIASSQNAADAIVINASAGGVDITAAGGAAEDIDLTNTAGSINLTAGENAADAIVLNSSAGGIDITAAGGTGEDIDIVNTAGSININAGEAVTDAINVDSSGGFDLDAAGQVNIASSQSAADSVVITSSAGGIDITATGAAAGEDIDIIATGSSVNINSTENVADSIVISSTNGGIDITATGAAAGEDIDISASSSINLTSTENVAQAIYIRANAGTSETVDIHSDQGTGVDSINIHSDVGGVTVASGLASADAINLSASAGGVDVDGALQVNIASSQAAVADSVRIVASAADGGVDIDSGTGGMTLDSTGAMSIDAAAASNFSVSGAGIDLTLASSGGRVVVNGEEAAADAVRLLSAAGGIDADAALQLSLVSSQAAVADSVHIEASAADGGVTISAGTGNINLSDSDVDVTGGNLILSGAGTQLQIESGAATDFVGTATLTAGTVTINNTNIAATDLIFLSRQSINGSTAVGELTYSISAATSFSITSVQPGTPASTETNDVSIVKYFIVRGI